MKSKISSDIIILIILIPVFLYMAFFFSSRANMLPKYSVINKSSNGCSVFFEALKELKMPVERTVKPVESIETNSVQILVQGGELDINGEEIKDWVDKGGTVVYLTEDNIPVVGYGLLPKIKGNISVYNHEKGKIIEVEASYFTNKTLTENTSDAYKLLEELDNYNFNKIYFNEAYLYSGQNNSLWDYVPVEVKFIIYQLVLTLFALFYFKGKHFGKLIPLYEELERSENEYLYSAASLYRQAKCWDLMLDNYYKEFLSILNCHEHNWLEYWKKEELPSYKKAERLYEFINSSKNKIKPKEYLQIVTIIEQLNRILIIRREQYWKTLKKTIK